MSTPDTRSPLLRRRPHRMILAGLGLLAGSAAASAVMAADTTPDGLDAAGWQRIQAQVQAQVDAEWVAGRASATRGEITGIHGLVRTNIVTGDYADLPPQGAPSGPEFGYSVAIEGDWLAVGAPGTIWTDPTFGTEEHGVVFVFQRAAGGWQPRQRIQVRAGYDGARCGHADALGLPHLVIGCPERAATAGGVRTGYIAQWKLNAETHLFESHHRLQGDTPARCGVSLALTRNYLAYGCPIGADFGRVGVQRRDPDTDRYSIFEGNRLPPSSVETPGMAFGSAVAMYEPPSPGLPPFNVRLAIGAPSTVYDGSIFPRGTVHLYDRALDEPDWSAATIFRLSEVGQDGSALASFGAAVAMNRDQLVVGAPNNRFGAIQTLPGPGSVHRYEHVNVFGSIHEWQAREAGGAVNLPDGPHSAMRFGVAVALGHDNLIAIAAPAADGRYADGDPADDVGLLELRRNGNGDWSVFNYQGELRPAPLNSISRPEGRFGQALDFDVTRKRLAAGYPRSGSTLVAPGQPDRPRGAVWIYETDELFAYGFQCATGAPGCN